MADSDVASLYWIQKDHLPEILPQLVSIEERSARDKWRGTNFIKQLEGSHTEARLAKVDDQIVGYLIYDINDADKSFHIRKLEVDPDFKNQGIEKQLIDDMKSKLTADGKSKLLFYVHEDDLELLSIFCRECGFQMEKELKKDFFRGGKGAYVVRHALDQHITFPPDKGFTLNGYNVGSSLSPGFEPMIVSASMPMPTMDVPGQAGANDDTPDDDAPSGPKHVKLSPAELLRRMLLKLQDMTGGMEWQVVKASPRGHLEATTIPNNLKSAEGLSFRTGGNVKNPQAANAALYKFFAVTQPRSHASAMTKAAQVDFPATWVRPIHLQLGYENQFAASFVPSDHHARPEKGDGEAQVR